jgi:hypothetical protein
MTKAERVEAVNEYWGKVCARTFFYLNSGLTEERALKQACQEIEGVPDECLEEWKEYNERAKWALDHPAAHRAAIEKAVREVVAERPI